MTTPTPRTDAAVRFVREQFHNDDCPDDHAAYAVAYLGGELSKMERFLAAARAELAQEQMARKHWMGMYAQEREKVEHLQVQLAGCGVAAMSNTREALTRAREATGQYGDSASYQDCLRAVEREIEERERADANAKDAERYRYLRSRDKDEVFNNDGVKAGVWIDCTSEDGALQLLTFEDADAAIDAAVAEGKK